MAKLERTYNIPLRKDFLRTPRYKRAKKAMSALRIFLQKHMKSDNIKISKQLNESLWNHGIKNPPHHIKVNVVKEDDGTVRAELFGAKKEEKKAKVRTPKGTKTTEKKAEAKAKTQEKPAEEAPVEEKPKKTATKTPKVVEA